MTTTSIPSRGALVAIALVGAAFFAASCARSRHPDRGEEPDAGPPPSDGGVDAGPGPCTDDADCDDGRVCTGTRFCDDEGVCRDGRPPDCARLLCFGAVCDPDVDACVVPDVDRDGDGIAGCPGGTDCDDRDADVSGGLAERCADGKDNDCDGLRDCVDPSCDGDPACADCDTITEELDCENGLDDDCDGLFDGEDPDCCVPLEGGEICINGTDGDCDGLMLCDDEDCAALPDCA